MADDVLPADEVAEPDTSAGLFRWGEFTAHSGQQLPFKIDCDALSADDWACLARVAVDQLPAFGSVEGVPTGGLAFAEALKAFATTGPVLIADDVCTTGTSMEAQRARRNALGVVVFARGPVPDWVTPLLVLPALLPLVRVPDEVESLRATVARLEADNEELRREAVGHERRLAIQADPARSVVTDPDTTEAER